MNNRNVYFILLLVALLAMPQTALAYLDPGSGSLLLQGLIALIVGTLASIGVYWQKLIAYFHKLRREKPADKLNKEGES